MLPLPRAVYCPLIHSKPINIELNNIDTATKPAPSHGQDYAINSGLPTNFGLTTTIDVLKTLSMSVMYTDLLEGTLAAAAASPPEMTSTTTSTSTSTIRITVAKATETATLERSA